ncbi:MAG: cell division protein ZapA [Paludibacteraceae bacterium]|nr:cell division protein ZapA [Paludibacteraceae bacterium]
MPDKLNIHLQLDTHSVSLSIDREQEQFYREGAKLLNQRYQYFRKVMPQATTEQLWMYVALQLAVNWRSDAHEKDLRPVEQELAALNQLVMQRLAQSQPDLVSSGEQE